MANQEGCYSNMDICGIRVAKLTTGGAPKVGTGVGNKNGYVSKAMQKLEVGVDVQTGNEFTELNGCGEIAATFKEPDKIKRTTLTMQLVLLDLPLLEFLTGDVLFHTTATPSTVRGFQFPSLTAAAPDHVSFEAWTRALNGNSPAVATPTSPLATYNHWVFPNTTWVHGNFALDHAITVMPVTGSGIENANITPNGPFEDWPADVAAAGGITHIGGMYYDGTIPTPNCDYIDIPTQA